MFHFPWLSHKKYLLGCFVWLRIQTSSALCIWFSCLQSLFCSTGPSLTADLYFPPYSVFYRKMDHMYRRSARILDLADSLPMMLFNPNPFYFCRLGVGFRGFIGSGSISSEDVSRWSVYFLLHHRLSLSLQCQIWSAGLGIIGWNHPLREPSYTVGGNADWYSHYGKQCGDFLKNWK